MSFLHAGAQELTKTMSKSPTTPATTAVAASQDAVAALSTPAATSESKVAGDQISVADEKMEKSVIEKRL